MVYFKRVSLPPSEKQKLENAIRKVALKRLHALDFESSVTDIGTDKLFLGLEDKVDVKFTRLRTSLEKYFPKFIISIPREETVNEYKLRYSLLSTIVFIALVLTLPLTIYATAMQNTGYESILFSLAVIAVYLLLSLFELRIINRKIKKAVKLSLTTK